MKRYVIISLIAASVITVGIASSLITSIIVNKKADDKKKELADYAMQVRFNDKCEAFRIENQYIKDVDISFIGDSLTEGYDVKTYYAEYTVVNRGISGDTTFGVAKRLDVSAYDIKPKIISLLIGANNFDSMLDNYSKILDGFKENIPNTKVVLCSLTSMTDKWARNNQKAINNNKVIKQYAEEYGYTYADLYNALLDSSTNELKEEYSRDGGHLTEKGYEIVTATLKPIFQQLISE